MLIKLSLLYPCNEFLTLRSASSHSVLSTSKLHFVLQPGSRSSVRGLLLTLRFTSNEPVDSKGQGELQLWAKET